MEKEPMPHISNNEKAKRMCILGQEHKVDALCSLDEMGRTGKQ